MITEEQHDKMVAEMLGQWRSEAGYTQVQMAELIGCSRSELQKIEYGTLKVKSYTIIKWAELTGHNPVLYMQHIVYPDVTRAGSSATKKKEKLIAGLDLCTEDELDALIEIYLKEHGGDRKALIHLMACYVRLLIGDRQNITLLITNCYRILTRKKKFRGFQPDLERIEQAREKGAEAHVNGSNKYRI